MQKKRVILSELAARKANGSAVEGSLHLFGGVCSGSVLALLSMHPGLDENRCEGGAPVKRQEILRLRELIRARSAQDDRLNWKLHEAPPELL